MRYKTNQLIALAAIIVAIVGIAGTIIHASMTYDERASHLLMSGQTDGEVLPEHLGGDWPERNSVDGEGAVENQPTDLAPHQGEQSPGMMPQYDGGRQMNQQPQKLLSVWHIVIIAFCGLILSLAVLYLLMSRRNHDFYCNSDKLTIYILSNIICTALIAVVTTLVVNAFTPETRPYFMEESTSRDEVLIDTSNIAESSSIDLSKQSANVTITKAGTYTFTGKTNYSIVVDAPSEEVKLVLDNVEISSTETAAIIGLAAQKITISTTEGSHNVLNDDGNSEYDGCIFSNAELVFDGKGILEVHGNQNEGEGIATEAQNITFQAGAYRVSSNDDGINAGGDGATITFNGGTFYIDAGGDGIDSNKNAIINGGMIFVMGSDVGGDAGIDTDDGYAINGGIVIALGSDMVETPLQSSKQKSLTFTLSNTIQKNTIVSLVKDGQAIMSFEASKSFKTIVISDATLDKGDYQLYTGGTHTGELVDGIYVGGSYKPGELLRVANQETFTVTGIADQFGGASRR